MAELPCELWTMVLNGVDATGACVLDPHARFIARQVCAQWHAIVTHLPRSTRDVLAARIPESAFTAGDLYGPTGGWPGARVDTEKWAKAHYLCLSAVASRSDTTVVGWLDAIWPEAPTWPLIACPQTRAHECALDGALHGGAACMCRGGRRHQTTCAVFARVWALALTAARSGCVAGTLAALCYLDLDARSPIDRARTMTLLDAALEGDRPLMVAAALSSVVPWGPSTSDARSDDTWCERVWVGACLKDATRVIAYLVGRSRTAIAPHAELLPSEPRTVFDAYAATDRVLMAAVQSGQVRVYEHFRERARWLRWSLDSVYDCAVEGTSLAVCAIVLDWLAREHDYVPTANAQPYLPREDGHFFLVTERWPGYVRAVDHGGPRLQRMFTKYAAVDIVERMGDLFEKGERFDCMVSLRHWKGLGHLLSLWAIAVRSGMMPFCPNIAQVWLAERRRLPSERFDEAMRAFWSAWSDPDEPGAESERLAVGSFWRSRCTIVRIPHAAVMIPHLEAHFVDAKDMIVDALRASGLVDSMLPDEATAPKEPTFCRRDRPH